MAKNFKDKINNSLRRNKKEKKVVKKPTYQEEELVRRETRDDIISMIGPDSYAIKAVSPELPPDDEDITCQFCGESILPEEPGVEKSSIEYQRKFRICKDCKENLIGHGGMIDKKTSDIAQVRRLK
jgi:hypothetical protein